MKNKRFLVWLVIFLVLFSPPSFSAATMTEETAHILAFSFFKKKYGTLISGGVADAVDRGRSWEFQPYQGVEAKPTFRKIRVRKNDGKAYFSYSFMNVFKVLFP